MNKQEEIRNYKVGQKVVIYGYIDAIDIENVSDIENTTTLRIKTPVKTISVNPKYEEVVTDFNKSKPLVPQFVAIWYEDNQDDFEFNLYRLCIDYYNCDLDMEMMIWFRDKCNNPIQTLTAMHQLGYIVKKEEIKKDY